MEDHIVLLKRIELLLKQRRLLFETLEYIASTWDSLPKTTADVFQVDSSLREHVVQLEIAMLEEDEISNRPDPKTEPATNNRAVKPGNEGECNL